MNPLTIAKGFLVFILLGATSAVTPAGAIEKLRIASFWI